MASFTSKATAYVLPDSAFPLLDTLPPPNTQPRPRSVSVEKVAANLGLGLLLALYYLVVGIACSGKSAPELVQFLQPKAALFVGLVISILNLQLDNGNVRLGDVFSLRAPRHGEPRRVSCAKGVFTRIMKRVGIAFLCVAVFLAVCSQLAPDFVESLLDVTIALGIAAYPVIWFASGCIIAVGVCAYALLPVQIMRGNIELGKLFALSAPEEEKD